MTHMTHMTGPEGPLTVNEAIGARCHQAMFLRRISARKMAPAIGVSGSILARKLRGTVAWSAVDVVAAAQHLNVSIAYLMGETSDPQPGGAGGDQGVVRPPGFEPGTQ